MKYDFIKHFFRTLSRLLCISQCLIKIVLLLQYFQWRGFLKLFWCTTLPILLDDPYPYRNCIDLSQPEFVVNPILRSKISQVLLKIQRQNEIKINCFRPSYNIGYIYNLGIRRKNYIEKLKKGIQRFPKSLFTDSMFWFWNHYAMLIVVACAVLYCWRTVMHIDAYHFPIFYPNFIVFGFVFYIKPELRVSNVIKQLICR